MSLRCPHCSAELDVTLSVGVEGEDGPEDDVLRCSCGLGLRLRLLPAVTYDSLEFADEDPKTLRARFMYFMWSETTGLIKIGFSVDPETRRVAMDVCEQARDRGGPTLLAVVPGGKRLEEYLHRKLADHRVEGEWFEPAVPVLEVFQDLMWCQR